MIEKFWKYKNTDSKEWTDWKWQMRNRLDHNSNIKDYFPNISTEEQAHFEAYIKDYHIAISPYMLSLIELDENGNPKKDDPIWNQFRYIKQDELQLEGEELQNENWEDPSELPTRILHHKYPDKAIFRLVDHCFSYCNYCYLSQRIISKESSETTTSFSSEWEKSLAYLRENPQIHDILLSGGDPFQLSNERLEKIFYDLSQIKSIKSMRINTRMLSFNPYRLDKELVLILKKYKLTAFEVHISHPKEITEVFDEKLALFDECGYMPLILWRAPLLSSVNDSVEVLEELFLKLYRRRIRPYYLFHYAPFTIGRSVYGISVKEGVKLLQNLRRRIPGPAFPQYTLFHLHGKQDIPLEMEGTESFKYTHDERGKPIIKFKNWKGDWVEYPDIARK